MSTQQAQITRAGFRRLYWMLGVVGAVLLVAVVICTLWTQHSSCHRSNEIRTDILHRSSASRLRLLDCDRLLPQE